MREEIRARCTNAPAAGIARAAILGRAEELAAPRRAERHVGSGTREATFITRREHPDNDRQQGRPDANDQRPDKERQGHERRDLAAAAGHGRRPYGATAGGKRTASKLEQTPIPSPRQPPCRASPDALSPLT